MQSVAHLTHHKVLICNTEAHVQVRGTLSVKARPRLCRRLNLTPLAFTTFLAYSTLHSYHNAFEKW